MGTKEWIIRSVKAFFITLMLYLVVLLILYIVFYKKIILPTSQSAAQTMTLNLQDFETSSSTQSEETLQDTSDTSVEASTKGLFEKIVHNAPNAIPTETNEENLEEMTKKLLQKIANAQKKPVKEVQKKENPVEKTLPNSNTKQEKQKILKAQLAKEEQEKHIKEENEKKIAQEAAILAQLEQERLIKMKDEEERLAKIEAEKPNKELEKRMKEEERENINKEIARLVQLDKEKLAQKEAKMRKQERLKKIAEKKRKEELRKKKARLAKEKLRKEKLEKKKKIQKKLTERKSKNRLAHSIVKTSTPFSERKSSSASMKMIKQFYGSEFNSFTGTQKSFIEKNLGNIYQITQRTLSRMGYPEVAARTQQQGTQLVTFYLHPNGAISGLHYKQRLGFASLDNNTMKIIKIAYKNYPRPKTTTKITFYVQYSLF